METSHNGKTLKWKCTKFMAMALSFSGKEVFR